MAHPIVVTDADFETKVIQADRPVLVDFWAEWCGPCKMIAPILEELATELEDRLLIAKMDVDHNPNTPMAYGIMSIPTLILFKDGQPVKSLVGFRPKDHLLKELEPHLQPATTQQS